MRLSEIDPNVLGPGVKSSIGQEYLDDPEKIVEYIRQYCSDIIEDIQATGKFLYRGIKRGDSAAVFVGRSREDRKPKDTANDVSAFFDKALASHGFKALRSNSIFVTSDHDHASSYGDTTYAIFPVNGFDYTYTDSSDLVIKTTQLVEYPKDLIPATEKWLNYSEKQIAQQVRADGNSRPLTIWTDIKVELKHLKSFAASKDSGASYLSSYFIALHNICRNLGRMAAYMPDDPLVKKFIYFDVSNPDNWSADAVIQNLNPKNTNIRQAMLDAKEICINGKYVALSVRHYPELISQLLTGKS